MHINDKDLHRIGSICLLLTRSRTYCQFPIACISEWIVPAVLLGQSILFRDSAGNLSGYMTWAFLAEDSERRILNDPNFLLHIGSGMKVIDHGSWTWLY
ncbi:toxin-activating lysine-acyltransferase [Xanthomonas arboricola]|uniref:toxin-activating lysine-acyltransferase n=1 Tax=Xanthomonas arboricola TaxID=56448 RepID=UPI003CE44E7F